MTRKPKLPASDTPKPAKIVSVDKARSIIMDISHDTDPESVIEKFAKALTDHTNSSGATQDKAYDKMSKLYPLAVSALSLDTHARIADVGGEQLGPLAIEMSRKLIVEYDCQTTAEKVLAELAAAAYIRILRYSTALGKAYDLGKASPELNKFMSVMSLEVDRANRQYLTAINTLKSFKQPTINVTFNAKTAFLAQHQNVNATQPQNSNGQANESQ